MRRRVGWWAPGVLLAVVLFPVVLFLVVVRLHPGGFRAGRGVDDVGQLLLRQQQDRSRGDPERGDALPQTAPG